MQQSKGFMELVKKDLVYRLRKCFYGLKQTSYQ